jgi:hypothetical protein
MDEYVITADGKLTGEGDFSTYTGTIEFYASNVVARGPGIYTENGEDAQWVEYRAVFVNGGLIEIQEVENRRERAMAAMKSKPFPRVTEEDRQRIDARRTESLVGRKMWLWWGGVGPENIGYPVTVIAESVNDWVVQGEDGKFEIVGRFQRDNCLHDSYESGNAINQERKAAWEREREEFEAAVREPRV